MVQYSALHRFLVDSKPATWISAVAWRSWFGVLLLLWAWRHSSSINSPQVNHGLPFELESVLGRFACIFAFLHLDFLDARHRMHWLFYSCRGGHLRFLWFICGILGCWCMFPPPVFPHPTFLIPSEQPHTVSLLHYQHMSLNLASCSRLLMHWSAGPCGEDKACPSRASHEAHG